MFVHGAEGGGVNKMRNSRQHLFLPQAFQFLLSTLSSRFCLRCLLLLRLELVGEHTEFVVFLNSISMFKLLLELFDSHV